MKVVQINCVFPGGSTGKITDSIHHYLKENADESYVFYGRSLTSNDKDAFRLCSNLYCKANTVLSMIRGIMYGGCYLSTKRLIKHIQQINPDIVHLHCINGNFVNIYKLIEFLKKNGFLTVLTLHAEFMYTGGCTHSLDCDKWRKNPGCVGCKDFKQKTNTLFLNRTHTMWQKMNSCLNGFGDRLYVTSVSPWLMNRAIESSIMKNLHHKLVLNGLDAKTFFYREKPSVLLPRKVMGKKIVLHVTPFFTDEANHIKGGRYVIDLAKKMLNRDVIFLVAGNYNEGMELPENIVLLGKILNQNELAEYYSLADVTLLTSEKETFSMIVAESLCCGTPIVGFKAGAPEMITINEYSEFVEFGNTTELLNAIDRFLSFNQKKQLSQEALRKYSSELMCKSYYTTYKDLVKKNRELICQ